MAQVRIDMKAPVFSLTDFTGKPFSLADYEGKKLVLLVFNRGFT